MLGIGTLDVRTAVNDKYFIISHLLKRFDICNVSFNAVDKFIIISVDRNDEFSMAKVQKVLRYASSDQSIKVSQRQLKANPNIIYCMTFKEIKQVA